MVRITSYNCVCECGLLTLQSARSDAERDQWIQAIKAQMGIKRYHPAFQYLLYIESSSLHISILYLVACSERKPAVNKPKRWKTFRNAFRIPQRHQKASARSSKITKRKTIMERLRLRRSNVPAPLQIGKEFNEQSLKHDRPLSDEIPQDVLTALEDVVPSRSLPATPLVRKRSDPTPHLSSPETPDPETPNSPACVMSVPVEVSYPPVNNDAAEQDSTSGKHLGAPSEIERFNDRQFVWDEIREKLLSDDTVASEEYQENQEWMAPSSGLEQLRAFLAVCD